MAFPFSLPRPGTVCAGVRVGSNKHAILRHAVAVLTSARDTRNGVTVLYPDGTTAYLAYETVCETTDRAPAKVRA